MSGDDVEIFARWIAGDRGAGDELSRRHYWSVHRFFELRAPASADDLTQRTFLACTEARARYASAGSFRAFLFGIARRQLLLHLRSRRATQTHFDLVRRESASPEPTPSGLVSMREEQRILLMAMSALPVYLQTSVQLHYWEGMKAREIAEALGITTSAVTTRLNRARARLHEIVARHPRPRARDALLSDLNGWARSLAGAPLPTMFG